MRFHYSAATLALITTTALAEECPSGYAKAKGLAWTDCAKGENGSQLQCATIEVPKDWKDEASPKMKLHLVRQPAKTKSARGERSVIVNPGGPGASGIQTVVEGGESTQATLGDDLHVIGFDPRGVGLTIPYTCSAENTKTARAVKEIEDQQGSYSANVELADKCHKNQADGDLVGTAYVARDVKAIAEALGEDGMIRYLGYSYGTLLGATLAAMFPTKVDRIVLDGNINPQSYYHKLQTESSADTDSAFKHFFELCSKAKQGSCAWAEDGKDGTQLTQKFDDFLDTLSVDQSNVVREKFFMMLYDPSKFKQFASTLQGWKTAPTIIPQRSTSNEETKKKRDTFEVKEYAKNKTPDAISGIQCSDKITRLQGSPENFKKWQEEYRVVTKYAYDTASNNDLQCSVWQTIAKERFDIPQSGIVTANPILFVNTHYDPVTPMDSAVNSAKSFTKSVVLKSSGVGHCSNVNPSQKLNDAIKEYMASGELPNITSYTPDKENVFDEEEAEKAVTPGKASKRDFRYPTFFLKREEAAAAEQIPAGCTKVPSSSSALVSPSASVVPSASASLSVSLSDSVSASQSPEPTPAASPSASAIASESVILSHSESASVSILVAPSISASESHEPTPSPSLSVAASASASESDVFSHSESASASALVVPSVSASEPYEPTPSPSLSVAASASASESDVLSHSESASVSILASPSASISASHEPSPAASASVSASASELLVPSHSESASASVSVQQSSDNHVQASATPSASQSESYALTPTASVSAQSESASISVAHASLSVQHSEVSPSASASITAEQGFQSSSAVFSASFSAYDLPSPSASASIDHVLVSSAAELLSSSQVTTSASASASVSVDYLALSSSIGHPSSYYPAESLTPSASATPVYDQNSASITASASYSAASSAEHVSSSDLYLSSDIQVSQSASSYPALVPSSSGHVGVSSSIYADSSSSTHVSGSVSQSYSVPVPSSSISYSDSPVVHISASSNAAYPDTSVYPSGSSSVVSSESSQYLSSPSSSVAYPDSSVVRSSASSTGSYYPASTPAYSSGSSTFGSDYPQTKPVHNHYPTSRPYASSTPVRSYPDQPKSVDSKYRGSSFVPSYPSSVPSYPQGPKSVEYKGDFFTNDPARSSSVPSYPKSGDYPGSGDYPNGNAYPTGFYPVTTAGKPKGPKTTSAPCVTVPWSSQPGYVPITKTYTTTTVRTITKCLNTVKDCPLNSSTKTYITTETKTRTTVVATPSSPPTGNKSYPPSKESGKDSSPPSKETGKAPSPPKDSSYPSQPANPSQPAKETGKNGQPPKETKPISPSQPAKDTSYSSQPSKPTGNSPQPPKETKPIQSTHSAYAPPKISSKPSAPTSVPPYPTGPSSPSSIKVCNDLKCSYVAVPTGTKPVVGTGASTTLRTSTPSVSICFGKDCKATGTPTGYKPAEFTGAASSNFVSSMVGAGAMIIAFVRFF